ARRHRRGAGAADVAGDHRHSRARPGGRRRRDVRRHGGTRDHAHRARPEGGFGGAMTRILLVDDSAEVRRSMRAMLAELLESVTFGDAPDAAAALDALPGEAWDLVLLDLSLPDRSGFETLRHIRRLRP